MSVAWLFVVMKTAVSACKKHIIHEHQNTDVKQQLLEVDSIAGSSVSIFSFALKVIIQQTP